MARRGWWKVRCHAHSKRTGLPCRRWAIEGGYVCMAHGGAIGHVRLAAQKRLVEAKLERKLVRPLSEFERSRLTGDNAGWRRNVSTLLAEVKASLAE